MKSSRIRENAGLLLVWSVFALVEGTIRMVINSKPGPSGDIDYFTSQGGTIVPIVALLAGGVAEVLFGILGVYLAFFSLILNKNSPKVTFMFLILQAILGWFVFLTFVIADPVVAAIDATGNALLTQNEQRALILVGNMLGSITFCWALQGGQFIMILRLWQSQLGHAENKDKNALRARIWSGNMVAAAISTVFVGAILQSKSFTSTTAPVPAPPHVVWRPWLSIVTSAFMFTYGAVGFVAAKDLAFAHLMPKLFVATTTAMMINFSWTFGIVPGLAEPIPGAAQHIGLILAVTVLPIYHTHRAHIDIEDENGFLDDDATDIKVQIDDGSASDV